MKVKWEYTTSFFVISLKNRATDLARELDKYGQDGWEAFDIQYQPGGGGLFVTATFKRPTESAGVNNG